MNNFLEEEFNTHNPKMGCNFKLKLSEDRRSYAYHILDYLGFTLKRIILNNPELHNSDLNLDLDKGLEILGGVLRQSQISSEKNRDD